MKKIIIAACAALLLVMLCACAPAKKTEETHTIEVGEWKTATSPSDILPDESAAFNKAAKGTTLTPTAYMGATAASDSDAAYVCLSGTDIYTAIVTSEGTLTAVKPVDLAFFTTASASDIPYENAGLTGGWKLNTAAAVLPDDIQTAFDKATKDFVGMKYVPVAYLGNQVYGGMNHALLCSATAESGENAMVMVMLHIDEKNAAAITGITPFGFTE